MYTATNINIISINIQYVDHVIFFLSGMKGWKCMFFNNIPTVQLNIFQRGKKLSVEKKIHKTFVKGVSYENYLI